MPPVRSTKRNTQSRSVGKTAKTAPGSKGETKQQIKERERATVNMSASSCNMHSLEGVANPRDRKRTKKENDIRFGNVPIPEVKISTIQIMEKQLRLSPDKPVKDSLGYEVDPDMLGGRSRRTKPSISKVERVMAEEKTEEEIKVDALFPNGGYNRNKVSVAQQSAWDDKVAVDLDIPFHKVAQDVRWFTVWKEKGFKVEPDFFEGYTREFGERITSIQIGSAFRK